MAASDATVRIKLSANSKQAVSEVDKLRSSITSLTTSKGWKNLVTGVGVGAGLAAFNSLTGAVSGLASTLADGVRAAAEEEAGIARLTAALRANVPAWDGNTAAIESTIKARRELAFSDDDLRQSFGSIVAATHDVSQAFEVQQTAMDLARFKGISLAEASDALVKVEAGQYRVLKSLGIVLKDGATQTDALAAVQAVAAGQAEQYSNSTAGALTKLSDSVDELKEALGNRLLPIIKPVTDGLRSIAESDEALTALAFVLGTTLVTAAAALFAALAPVVAEVTAMTVGLNILIPLLITAGSSYVAYAKRADVAAESSRLAQVRVAELNDTMAGTGLAADTATRGVDSYAQELAKMGQAATGMDAVAKSLDSFRRSERQSWVDARTSVGAAADAIEEQLPKAAKAAAVGLAEGADAVKTAMQGLVDAIANEVPRAQRAGELVGILTSRKVADGLKSGDPLVVAATRTLIASIETQLKGLGYKALALGAQTAKLLATGFGGPGGNQMVSNAALDAVKDYAKFIKDFGTTKVEWPKPDTSGIASAASDITGLLTSAKGAIAGLKGLGATLRDLVSTFSSSWTPTVLTSAQASGALQAALGKVQTAVAGLKVGVESTRAAVANAFEAMRQAAANYFEAVHRERLRDLADANSAIQSQLSAQIGAINAGLSAQRAAIEAARDARREADLREALANAQGSYSDPLQAQLAGMRDQQRLQARADEEARLKANVSAARTRRDRAAAQDALDAFYERVRLEELEATYQQNTAIEDAQQNLSDFLADEALQRAETAGQARISALEAERAHQQSLYDAQVEAENQRYAAQTAALDKMIGGLTTGLDAMKEVWTSKNKQVLALLKGYLGDFKSAGAAAAQAVADGIASVTIPAPVIPAPVAATVPTATKTTTKTTATVSGHRADGGPVYAGRTYVVGEQGPEYLTMGSQPGYVTPNQGGASGQPVVINLTVDGKTLARVVDERLFYAFRTAARTGSAL